MPAVWIFLLRLLERLALRRLTDRRQQGREEDATQETTTHIIRPDHEVYFVYRDRTQHQHPRPRLTIGPFDMLGVSFTMPSQVTAPNGAKGTAKLAPAPDGAAFVGTPTIVSSDPNVVTVTDHGDGTADLVVAGAEGQTCTITGTDSGNGFADTCEITVGAPVPPPPPAETGVVLTVAF